MDDIGNRIKTVRKQLGLSQADLGKHAGGLSKSAVHQWENGGTKPAWEALTALRKGLGLNPDWIMKGEGSMLLEHRQPNTGPSLEPGSDGLPFDGLGLTPEQRALLGNFARMTADQRANFLSESENIKRNNEKIIEELVNKRTSNSDRY
ncbi:MAG: helix-turn-helix domain-containing protein [Acidithiobacillus sp.]